MGYDFSGYATKNDLTCGDRRIIRRDAFKDNDHTTVPLVWHHIHDNPDNVLGHADLENRPDGVYAYCTFNNTKAGQNAKQSVQHGDITSMSIYANKLVQQGNNVIHGLIREVSLVMAGANPGALIDPLSIAHSDGSYTDIDDEAIIYTGEEFITHSEEKAEPMKTGNDSGDEKTVEDVLDTMNDEQLKVLKFLVSEALSSAK